MKQFIVTLLLTGGAIGLHAQKDNSYYLSLRSLYPGGVITRTEQTFNYPPPGKLRVNFTFYNVQGSTNITLELTSIKQLKYLSNIDSLLSEVKSTLQPFADSLKQDGIVRRIDYIFTGVKPEIRILNHENLSNAWLIEKGALTNLKTEQDTVRIRRYITTGDSIRLLINGKYVNRDELLPFFITLQVNNITDLNALPDTILQHCVNRLRQDITDAYLKKASKTDNYTAVYNVKTDKLISPTKTKYISWGWHRPELVPNVYTSLQFVRGSLAPSMAIGLRYTLSDRNYNIRHFYAMWEPYFFFSRDLNNTLHTDWNSFMTLRYEEIERNRKAGFEFVSNFSVAYLISRKGEWLDAHTFKVGVPGVRSGWLQLEPEFLFHGLLTDFSPSIKMTIHFE